MEQLQSKLHSYSQYGLPTMPRQLSFHQDSWEEEETNLVMEDSWQMLLDDPQVQTQRGGGGGLRAAGALTSLYLSRMVDSSCWIKTKGRKYRSYLQ